MKDQTPIEDVVTQIKNVCESLDSQWVKVSFLLQQTDLSQVAEAVDQRDSAYPVASLLKLYIYKRIKGVPTHPKLANEIDAEDLQHLGLTQLPTKQNYNYFLRTKITQSIKNNLDMIVENILAITTTKSIVLDLPVVKKSVAGFANKAREERAVAKETIRFLKRFVYPQIPISIGKNSKFTSKDLLDILVHVAHSHDFTTNGCKTFQDLYEDEESPNGETLLYHFRKMQSQEKIEMIFQNITNAIFTFAKKQGLLMNQRKFDIAFDIHKIPFYGSHNDPYVKGSKHERGTSYFYHFLTCDIVVGGKQFTIDVTPVHPMDDVAELLDQSLQRVRKRIHIDTALLDRAFANSNCIAVLRKNNTKFIMPVPKNERIKQWIHKSEACPARLIEHYELKDQVVHLYLIDDKEGDKKCFITNRHVPVQLAHYFYEWYSKRWGIETGYRLKAHDFRARTTSKNYHLRLFYFLFSCMLYNLWVLTNLMVSINLYSKIPTTPIISAKRFNVLLGKVQEEETEPGG